MQAQVDALKKLQEIDRDIRSFGRTREGCPRRLEEAMTVIAAKRGEAEKVRERIKAKRMDVEAAELELRANRQKIDELKVKLNTASTNEEYSILRSQIERLGQDIERIEDGALEEMEVIEGLLAEEREVNVEVDALESDYEQSAEMVRGEIQELDEQIRECREHRDIAVREIDQELLERYERVLRRTGDSALARVLENTCLGCHMSITKQLLNELLSGNEIIQCPSCARILYVDE